MSEKLNYFFYRFQSTIRPFIEYYCHVWAGAPRCYLELLDKLQKQICFYRYYFGRCSSELVPLPNSRRGLLVILIDCMIFLLLFLNVTKMSMSAVSFVTQLDWNSLFIESFPLNYDVSGFKSRLTDIF